MSKERDKLVSYINNGVVNITRDCQTFVWAKLNHHLERISKTKQLGGGNLLSGLGLMATLGYLSTINAVWDADGFDNVERKTSDKKHPSVQEPWAFSKLAKKYRQMYPIFDVYPKTSPQIEKVYQYYRNGLAHYLRQKLLNDRRQEYIGTIRAVSGNETPGTAFREKYEYYMLTRTGPPFILVNNKNKQYDLFVENLINWINNVAGTLCVEINTESKKSRVKKTLDYVIKKIKQDPETDA